MPLARQNLRDQPLADNEPVKNQEPIPTIKPSYVKTVIEPMETTTDMQPNMTAQTDNPSAGDVAVLAYYIWEQEGSPQGRDFEHWVEAEAQLKAATQQTPPGAIKEQMTLLQSDRNGDSPRAQLKGVPQKRRAHRVQLQRSPSVG